MISVALVMHELKSNLSSLWTPIMVILSSLLTFSGGVEYAGRGGVTDAAEALGIAAVTQEWAHRISFAAAGLPLLAVTAAVWLWTARDRCHNFAQLVAARPVLTSHLAAARVTAALGGVFIPHFGGVLAGVLLVGVVTGLWPDCGIFMQCLILNLIPGLTAWITVVYAVTSSF